jgi:hypothetical protein
MIIRRYLCILLCGGLLVLIARGQGDGDEQIAARYAPVFHQALGGHPRGDYPTNFDFDGDWKGTNNWSHAGSKNFALKGYIYYSVRETETHYYIHYAVFHARDYKGGVRKGVIYSDLLWLGARVLSKGRAPSGKLALAAIAHENDMEGALVVVDKLSGRPVYLETVHHNLFGKYRPDGDTGLADGYFTTAGDHVELYVQPRGHGIQPLGTESRKALKGMVVYTYSGTADDPEKAAEGRVGYELLPIATTLWPMVEHGQSSKTYASEKDFGTVKINVRSGSSTLCHDVQLGMLPSAFEGQVGGENVARPPWGWFSNARPNDPPGIWYFDPAGVIKRDFQLADSFSTAYVSLPFWAQRSEDTSAAPLQVGERK